MRSNVFRQHYVFLVRTRLPPFFLHPATPILEVPCPFLLTAEVWPAPNSPDSIEVCVDNVPATENVSRFLGRSGYVTDIRQSGDSEWKVCGRKAGINCAEAEEIIADAGTEPSGKTLVLLTSDVIGSGSDELGAKLMGNFLSTLPEMNGLWRIVMVNGGVRLASTPGKALDALKKLEASGVGILVCGTCLEFFHLTEQKQVGETTNMLDIVTSLDLADKVIRP